MHDCFELKRPLPDVAIVKCYLDADSFMIDALVEKGVDGIVLEGVGRGQVAPKMMPGILRALQKQIPVVITTSAEEGNVYTTYDYLGSTFDLFNQGVILGKDYDSKKSAHAFNGASSFRKRCDASQFLLNRRELNLK